MARWHSCNVLQAGANGRQLWQFDAGKREFPLSRTESAGADARLAGHLIEKSWRSLWQPRLNVAWLPPASVFLRVVHLPQSSFAETLSMVELQLEKLSPIPVTQLVWSVQPMSQSATGLQTLVVILAERQAVESFLGELEGHGYLADRIEVPALDQLQATEAKEDGAWIYPGLSGSPNTALVAWWYGGVLQSLNLLTMPATTDRAGNLKEQLSQMAWAGELEGWLTSPPAWHLVADETNAAEWEALLRQGLNQPLTIDPPLNQVELAARTAKRAATADANGSLLPPEFAKRYRLQFQDRLWMRGLLAVGVVYCACIAIYLAALGVQYFRVTRVEGAVKELSLSYTNATRLKEQFRVLKDRQDLKFAALDSLMAVATLLPTDATLDTFNFVDGRKVVLNGTVPAEQMESITEFNRDIRRYEVNGQPLFDAAKTEAPNLRTINPTTVSWTFSLELKRTEAK